MLSSKSSWPAINSPVTLSYWVKEIGSWAPANDSRRDAPLEVVEDLSVTEPPDRFSSFWSPTPLLRIVLRSLPAKSTRPAAAELL